MTNMQTVPLELGKRHFSFQILTCAFLFCLLLTTNWFFDLYFCSLSIFCRLAWSKVKEGNKDKDFNDIIISLNQVFLNTFGRNYNPSSKDLLFFMLVGLNRFQFGFKKNKTKGLKKNLWKLTRFFLRFNNWTSNFHFSFLFLKRIQLLLWGIKMNTCFYVLQSIIQNNII